MGLYDTYKTDEKKELEGALVKVPLQDGSFAGFYLRSTSFLNKGYNKYLYEESSKLKLKDPDSKSEDKAQKVLDTAFVKFILVGWDENVKDEKGKAIEFNEKNALKLIHDLPHLYNILQSKAESRATFKREVIEETTKK